MKDNKLEVGDELYYRCGTGGYIVYEGMIDRVTDTIAFIGKEYFRRLLELHIDELAIARPGEEATKWFYIVSDSIKNEIIKQRARDEQERIFFALFFFNTIEQSVSRLTDSQLSRIIGILEEEK